MTSRSGSTRLLNLHLSLTAPVVALSVHATGTDGAGAGIAAQMVTIMFNHVHFAAVRPLFSAPGRCQDGEDH